MSTPIANYIKSALYKEAESGVRKIAAKARTMVKKRVTKAIKKRGKRVLKRATKKIPASTKSFKALSKVRSGYVNRAFNTEITCTGNTLNTTEILSTLTQGPQNDQRRGNKILLKGLSWSMEWRNKSNLPLYVNFAILTPLQGAGVDDTNFFRDLDVENNIDFSTTGTLSGWNRHTRSLNRDKYIIHKHKRFWLGACQATVNASSCKRESYRSMKFYMPMNANVTFSTQGGSELPDQKICYAIWFNRAFTGGPASVITGTADLVVNFETMIYFNNI